MDMQNVSNLTISEGQVRTIHNKDNELLWGRVAYDVKYAGDSFQQTYTGKNLFNGTGWRSVRTSQGFPDPSSSGGTIVSSDSNNIKFNSPSNYTGVESGFIPVSNNQKFVVSFTIVKTCNRLFVTQYDSSQNRVSVLRTVTSPGTTTFTASQDGYVTVAFANTSADNGLEFENIQLELGASATSYEPFVGSTSTQITPAPNPDYPQDISVVTGEQTVKLTGKNMAQTTDCNISGTNYSMSISKGSVELKSQATNVCFDLNAGIRLGAWMPNYASAPDHHLTGNGGTYVVSFHDTSTSGLNSNAIVSVFTNKRSNSITISNTLPLRNINISLDSDEYVKAILYWIGSGTTDCTIKFKVQLEQGSTSSSYESYQSKTCQLSLGSTELVKVNTSRDYIYSSNGDWYIHNDIEKIASYNGETITTDYMSTTGQLTTGSTVYYVLSSPTDTQITGTTLISQLDAIHEWVTRYGYSATVTGNLPIIIDRTNL